MKTIKLGLVKVNWWQVLNPVEGKGQQHKKDRPPHCSFKNGKKTDLIHTGSFCVLSLGPFKVLSRKKSVSVMHCFTCKTGI